MPTHIEIPLKETSPWEVFTSGGLVISKIYKFLLILRVLGDRERIHFTNVRLIKVFVQTRRG